MKFDVQAKLLAEALYWGLINHAKVVAWVDEVIARSDSAQPWMLDISLSDPKDSEECAFLLNKAVGWRKIIGLTEGVAVITYLYQKMGKPLYECLHLLQIEHDEFLCPENDLDSQRARDLILKLEARCFAEDYSEMSTQEVTPPLEEMAKGLQAKHPEIIEFMDRFA